MRLPGLPALCLALIAATASAAEYGHYDPKRLLTVSETPAGRKYGLDGVYLDRMLNDLSVHAKNYPPQFDSGEDRQRAEHDVKALAGMLDIALGGPTQNPDLLVRAAALQGIAHNLDIPGSAEKADALFRKLLAAQPGDARGSYLYGTFLAASARPKEALPHLDRALAAGVADAAYTLGMVHLSLGNREQALRSLEDYKRRKPDDASVDRLIEAIRNGKIEIRNRPG